MTHYTNTSHERVELEKLSSINLNESPLVSVGMQARSFAAAINHAGTVAPSFYDEASLASDVEELCDPNRPVNDAKLLNVAVKFFYSYVYEGAHQEPVTYSEIAGLYELFSRHQSLNEPGDDIELMNRLRQWSSVLKVLADAPRAAHVMRAVIGQENAPVFRGGPYVGVDIGAGTGIVLIAQQIQARRNGFSDIQTLGYQSDPVSGERTHDLVHSIGAGSVMLADPSREGAYGLLRGRHISYVANEMVAGMQLSLNEANFFGKYRAFFRAVGAGADNAVFFPEGIIAHSDREGTSAILVKDNQFKAPPNHGDVGLSPQGLIIEGAVLPMHKLGQEFYRYLV